MITIRLLYDVLYKDLHTNNLDPSHIGHSDRSSRLLISALAMVADTRHNNPLVDIMGSPSLEAGFGL